MEQLHMVKCSLPKLRLPCTFAAFLLINRYWSFIFQVFLYDRNQLVLIPDEGLDSKWDQNIGIAQWESKGFPFSEGTIEMTSLSACFKVGLVLLSLRLREYLARSALQKKACTRCARNVFYISTRLQ